MTGYVIMSMNIDFPTCDDDGMTNGIGFGLVVEKVYKDVDEAYHDVDLFMKDSKRLIEENFPECKVIIEDGRWMGEKVLRVYDGGELTNSTHYLVESVEF